MKLSNAEATQLLPPFKHSEPYTLGIELELQLINPTTFNLTAASPDLIYWLTHSDFPGIYTPEVTESMIEVCTHVHHSYAAISHQLQQIQEQLLTAGRQLNISIAGGGTHPFQSWAEQRIFAKDRFQQLSERYGYLAKQFTVFGQHVHVGCPNADAALYLVHSLSRYVPHFIALAASSPFVQRCDTSFHSARLNSVFAFPLSGHAPFILQWDEFEQDYFAKMQRTGTIKSMKDFYWDIRPKPEYGTIELRVCDTPLTVAKAALFAAYLQILCYYLLEHKRFQPQADDYLVYNYNRFQACRFGLEGVVVDPRTYQQRTIAQDIVATLDQLAASAKALDATAAFEQIAQVVAAGNDASWLRKQYAATSSLEGMVSAAIEKFKGNG